jgi:hypothetical protein
VSRKARKKKQRVQDRSVFIGYSMNGDPEQLKMVESIKIELTDVMRSAPPGAAAGLPDIETMSHHESVHEADLYVEAPSEATTKISRPPGSLLRSVADFFCSIPTMTNVVDPAIADMQFEIYEALKAHRPQKARWILIRGYWGVAVAIGLVQTLRRVSQILKF